MSISNTTSPSSSPPLALVSASASQTRASTLSDSGGQHVTTDSLTQQLQPPRFPWLSRLASQLEAAAAEKKRVFGDAPQLGDNLDEKA